MMMIGTRQKETSLSFFFLQNLLHEQSGGHLDGYQGMRSDIVKEGQ